jgi:hypothetical protein
VFSPDGTPASGLPANKPDPSQPGVIPLPAHGVDLSYTVPPYKDVPSPVAATWNASWKFSPKCQVTLPNNFKQNAGPERTPCREIHYKKFRDHL